MPITVKSWMLDALAGSSDTRSLTPVSDHRIGPPASRASARSPVVSSNGADSKAPPATPNSDRRLMLAVVSPFISMALPFAIGYWLLAIGFDSEVVSRGTQVRPQSGNSCLTPCHPY